MPHSLQSPWLVSSAAFSIIQWCLHVFSTAGPAAASTMFRSSNTTTRRTNRDNSGELARFHHGSGRLHSGETPAIDRDFGWPDPQDGVSYIRILLRTLLLRNGREWSMKMPRDGRARSWQGDETQRNSSSEQRDRGWCPPRSDGQGQVGKTIRSSLRLDVTPLPDRGSQPFGQMSLKTLSGFAHGPERLL
jgi:hypothetical protein